MIHQVSAYGVAVSGNYAYVADYGAGLRVVDVSNPANPVEVGYYDTPDCAIGVAVSAATPMWRIKCGSSGSECIKPASSRSGLL